MRVAAVNLNFYDLLAEKWIHQYVQVGKRAGNCTYQLRFVADFPAQHNFPASGSKYYLTEWIQFWNFGEETSLSASYKILGYNQY